MRSGEVCIYKDPKAWTSGFCNFFWQGMMSLVGGNQLPLASGRSTSASTPPILSPPSFDIERCITHYIHGDEGRGHLKRPYLVISGNLSLDIMVCRMQCGLCHGCCCAEICKNVNDNLESVGVMAQRQEIENGLARQWASLQGGVHTGPFPGPSFESAWHWNLSIFHAQERCSHCCCWSRHESTGGSVAIEFAVDEGKRKDQCHFNQAMAKETNNLLPQPSGIFAILCGSSVSPACLQRMKKEDVPQNCPCCHEKCVPTCIHLAWHCKHWDDLRSQILGTGFSVWPTKRLASTTLH